VGRCLRPALGGSRVRGSGSEVRGSREVAWIERLIGLVASLRRYLSLALSRLLYLPIYHAPWYRCSCGIGLARPCCRCSIDLGSLEGSHAGDRERRSYSGRLVPRRSRVAEGSGARRHRHQGRGRSCRYRSLTASRPHTLRWCWCWCCAISLTRCARCAARTGLKGSDVSEVIFGNVVSGGIGQAPARQAAIRAGTQRASLLPSTRHKLRYTSAIEYTRVWP